MQENMQKHQRLSTKGKWDKVGPLGTTWSGQSTLPRVAQPGPTSATSPILMPRQETQSRAHPSIGSTPVDDQRLK
jgi:hypothetical protein